MALPGAVRKGLAYFVVFCVACIYGAFWWVYNRMTSPHIGGLIAFNLTFALALWSYLATALTDPGTSECIEWKAWAAQLRTEDLPEGPRSRGWRPGVSTYCEKCSAWRPERAHHCKMLGVCVLRMDHFCPWTANCIGWRNHKHFILLNFWLMWATFFFLVTLSKPDALSALGFGVTASKVGDYVSGGAPAFPVSVCVLFAIVFMCVGLALFSHGIYYACKNLTQVENTFEGTNPYELPSSTANMFQLIGRCGPFTLLPLAVGEGERECDGTSFPCASKSGTGYGAAV